MTETEDGARLVGCGVNSRDSMKERLRINTSVGATWTIAGKPSPKKRKARKKSSAPEPVFALAAPWYVRNRGDIVSAAAAIFAVVSYLHAAGWLTGPAKQSDFTSLSEKVQLTEKRGQDADARISLTVSDAVTEIKEHRGALARLESELSHIRGQLDGVRRKITPDQ